jgi:hypothetical protein
MKFYYLGKFHSSPTVDVAAFAHSEAISGKCVERKLLMMEIASSLKSLDDEERERDPPSPHAVLPLFIAL